MERSEPWAANHQSPSVNLPGTPLPTPRFLDQTGSKAFTGAPNQRTALKRATSHLVPKVRLRGLASPASGAELGPLADRAQPRFRSQVPVTGGAEQRDHAGAPPSPRRAAPGTRPLPGDTRRRRHTSRPGYVAWGPSHRPGCSSAADQRRRSLPPVPSHPEAARRWAQVPDAWSERTTDHPAPPPLPLPLLHRDPAGRVPQPRRRAGDGAGTPAPPPEPLPNKVTRRMKCASGVTAGW